MHKIFSTFWSVLQSRTLKHKKSMLLCISAKQHRFHFIGS
ncbi:hypothetical protein FAEPRAA2165_02330 [Faecalibacterium duncaniae]|uniref:Uncharacterized protein n=1 Tax=Faecalibacterium duncaniae (strain DSM 17677 / JCM 31915 / A2-165) TaxID=411483 RepID=C7H7P5_FAED2|nr:hypothetical protein FAEPRAA2165_02330 [Faecalibacterium duncaniae]